MRARHADRDVIRVVTPEYAFEFEVRPGRRPRLVRHAGRAGLLDALRRWLTPRIVGVACSTCGGQSTTEVRVSLPQMVAHRAAACRVCPHRRWLFCGLCKCFLPLKHRVAAATCPDTPDRWIERTT